MGNAYRSVLALKPTGDAVPANVLSGKTFSNADGTGKTGTMANNGAVSITLTDLNPTYTIPEGYHNGLGVVSFTSSGGDGADLIVTCSGDFAGTTITCTDGTTTFEEICPSTSPYQVVFQSIPTGTWTISGTYSGHTLSTIFTVLNFETELNSIPEGSTVTPTDDIQTWLNCANIWDKSYTTITQVLNDVSTLQALIASNNAADYMARSTTWASNVTADSSAMTYIGLNDYCANKLLADAAWLNAICNSTYFESVLNVKVPTMTSSTAPSGEVIQSRGNGWGAFDGNPNTDSRWVAGQGSQIDYLGYIFTENVKLYKFKISYSSVVQSCNYRLQAYKNGTWTDESESMSSLSTNKNLDASEISDRHRIYISSQTLVSGSSYYGNIVELQFYGRASS